MTISECSYPQYRKLFKFRLNDSWYISQIVDIAQFVDDGGVVGKVDIVCPKMVIPQLLYMKKENLNYCYSGNWDFDYNFWAYGLEYRTLDEFVKWCIIH